MAEAMTGPSHMADVGGTYVLLKRLSWHILAGGTPTAASGDADPCPIGSLFPLGWRTAWA